MSNWIKGTSLVFVGFLLGNMYVWNLLGYNCSQPAGNWFSTSLFGKIQCEVKK